MNTELPVVALSTDPAHVFDNNIGIYVVGKNGAKGRCGPKANYNQPWERPVSMELYETNGTLAFQQDVGFEIQGDCTRAMPQKSLEIKTVSYTHLRAHETVLDLVCRLLLEKKKNKDLVTSYKTPTTKNSK